MKTKTRYLLLFLSLCCALRAYPQPGFSMPSGMRQIDIPFEYVNHFMIITLIFNQTIQLKMIFDTGAEHTILSKREVSDIMQVQYDREFRLKGADMKTELIAYLARGIRLESPNLPFIAPREDILVLQEDYFRFEEYCGVKVHGILSAQAFARYIFKINYQRRVITLYDREQFVLPEQGFQQIPVEVFRNKLYMQTSVAFRGDQATPVKLLLDTGAAMPLLLFSNTDTLIQPPANAISSNIGMGLGGYLDGFVGRIDALNVGKFNQRNIVTFFQSIDTTQDLTYLNKRNGLVGNILLNGFQVIVDYYGASIWLKPTRNFNKTYLYDRSGLNIIAGGTSLNRFTVQAVLPNSPAAEAGFLPGDRLMRVGVFPTTILRLAELQKMFQKKPGKIVTVVIRREGKRIKKAVKLRDLI
jgi:hypothetical protein